MVIYTSADKPQSTSYILLCNFFLIPCVFNTLPEIRDQLWEISICRNFTKSLTRNDENLISFNLKMVTQVNNYGTSTRILDVVCINNGLVGMG